MSNKRISNEIVDANDINEILNIEEKDVTATLIFEWFGLFNGKRRFNPYDRITIPIGKYVLNNGKKNKNSFITTIGLWLANIFLFQKDLSHIVGYLNQTIGKKVYGKLDNEFSYALLEDRITVPQFKRYLMKTQFLMQFVSILAPNYSRDLLTCTRKINKKKDELFKKYKDEIDSGNIIVAENIEEELLNYAMELLGDDPSLDTFMSGARGNIKNNFKNIYIMKGAVRNSDPSAKQEYVIAKSNYIDGISRDEYALYANALVAGPYFRNKKTQNGGYWEKLFVYAFQHLRVGSQGSDCKTPYYIEVFLTSDNISKYMYNFIIGSNNELTELTYQNRDKFLDKTVKMRFSSMCKRVENGCFCNMCAGNFVYRVGSFKDIGPSLAQIPSKLKLIAMKSFHDSTVSTVEMDPMEVFGLKD